VQHIKAVDWRDLWKNFEFPSIFTSV